MTKVSKRELISGKVSELQVSASHEDFVFSRELKDVAGAASVGAAAVGQMFNSSALLIASGGAGISMQAFTCVVGSTRVVGRFHKVGFEDGEDIEFAGDFEQGVFCALAARAPVRRLMWVLPHHERGEAAYRSHSRYWTWLLSLTAGLLFVAFWWWKFAETPDIPNWFYPALFLGTTGICLIVNVFARSFFVRYAKEATQVFEALRFPGATEVDLSRLDRIAAKKLSADSELGKTLPPWTYRF